MGKKKIVREVWEGLGLTAFSGFFLQQTSTLNKNAVQYPRIILGILLAFSVALLIQGIYFSVNYEKYCEKQTKKEDLSLQMVGNPMLVFAATAVYLAIFHYVNFFVATAIFVPVLMLIFGERKVRRILLTTVGLELFVYLIFIKLLHVYFPI